jgi:hypothetical protein
MKSKFLATLVLSTIATASIAADVTGKWTAEGLTFDFKVEGEKLTGTAGPGRDDLPVSDGTVKGDEIAFYLVRSPIKIAYKGKVVGDVIKMSSWAAGAENAVHEFEATRVK